MINYDLSCQLHKFILLGKFHKRGRFMNEDRVTDQRLSERMLQFRQERFGLVARSFTFQQLLESRSGHERIRMHGFPKALRRWKTRRTFRYIRKGNFHEESDDGVKVFSLPQPA